MFSKLFCKHKWTKLSEITSKSVLDVTGGAKVRYWDITELTGRLHVVIATCDKCGSIKKFQTKLPA